MARTKSKLQTAAIGGTPEDVEAAFYEGLQSGDVEKVMACWADEDDIVCIHPGGPRLLGAARIRASFETLFSNGGRVQVTPESVHHVDAVASTVRHVLERAEVSTAQGTAYAYVLATNVYYKTAQGWRMVLHHASIGAQGPSSDDMHSHKVLH